MKRSIVNSRTKLYTVVGATLAALSLTGACGKKKKSNSDDNGGSLQAQGSVNASGTLALPPSLEGFVNLPTKIAAIPVLGGNSSYYGKSPAIKTFDVGNDGTFSADMTKYSVTENVVVSYVLAGYTPNTSQGSDLANRMAEASSMVFVGLASGNDNMINYPVNDAATDKMNLGKTTISGSDAKSEYSVSVTHYNLSDAALKQIATLSAPLKGIKNSYVNQDGYKVGPYFAWQGNNAPMISGSWTTGADTNPSTGGYGLYFRAPDNATVTMGSACRSVSDATQSFALIPPSAIRKNDGTTTDITELNSSGNSGTKVESSSRLSCNGNGATVYMWGRGSGDSTILGGFNWGDSKGYVLPVKSGTWTLKYDNSVVGLFDLQSASPLGSNSKPFVFMPSVRVTNSGGTVTKLEIRMMLYNSATDTYDVVTDLTGFKKVAYDLSVDLNKYAASGNKQEHVNLDISAADANGVFTITSDKFSSTWTISDLTTSNTNPNSQGTLDVSYSMYGYTFRTEFRKAP